MLDRSAISEEQVRLANQRFYDTVAGQYEDVDGRRSPRLQAWLSAKLAKIREDSPGGKLLDVGSGSGFLCRCAKDIFSFRVGMDVSEKILAANKDAFEKYAVGDVNKMPFEDEAFDAVTCFAVLHHLFDFAGLVSETRRVLKPGGVFYSDHDMESTFARRFRLPLTLYRKLRKADSHYRQIDDALTREMYELTEWNSSGVESLRLIELFEQAGFSVTAGYHWYGLSPVTDRLFGARMRTRGWAPLLSLIAKKKGN
jgi:ubiquinone/menaquinone biosynthesis C-methylase UbiE